MEREMNSQEQRNLSRLKGRIESRQIIEQKAWKFIREMNSWNEERLTRTALINGKRKYTYRQLFRQWERHAEVFAAIKITGKNGSRVAMTGNVSAECIIAFYALNMNGVSVSMIPVEETHDKEGWCETIRKEGITDLVIADAYAWPGFLRMIYFKKKELGLRNVIILPTYVDGPYAVPLERLQARTYEQVLKLYPDMERMDDLMKKYEATPNNLRVEGLDDAAVITHTSGTTRGIHKPIPLSDRGLNAAAINMMAHEVFKEFREDGGVTAVTKEMTAAYAMVNMVHVPLALGITNVILPMGGYNPAFHKAMKEYGVNILLANADMFSQWMGCPGNGPYDFSALSFVTLGGAYVSADQLSRINEFISKHGGKVRAVSGYGLSEVGGACMLPDPGEETRDTIGRPLPGVEVRILNEETGEYHTLEDRPCTGGLYISSETISSGRIDDMVFFEPEIIDGKPYICTYDLVTVEEDGSICYAGRMNRYFVNNQGTRFEAGIIETAVSKQPGIEGCAIVPKYVKEIYDTVPVLYVQTRGSGGKAVHTVRKALLKAFAGKDGIDQKSLPAECVITGRIPHNEAGKVDIQKITKGNVDGDTYTIKGILRDGKLTDIEFLPQCKGKSCISNKGGGFLPEAGAGTCMEEGIPGFGCDQMEYGEEEEGMGCDPMDRGEKEEGMGCDQVPTPVKLFKAICTLL